MNRFLVDLRDKYGIHFAAPTDEKMIMTTANRPQKQQPPQQIEQ